MQALRPDEVQVRRPRVPPAPPVPPVPVGPAEGFAEPRPGHARPPDHTRPPDQGRSPGHERRPDQMRRPDGRRAAGPSGATLDAIRPRTAPPPAPQEAGEPGKRSRRLPTVALMLAVALVSGVAGGAVGVVATRDRGLFGNGAAAGSAGDRTAAAAGTGGAAAGTPAALAGGQLQQVLGSVLPAVVKVEARTDTGKATGSGVVFAESGYVLTNAHVIDGARSIGVTLSTSEPLRARFVGRDLNYDLAVLKVRRAGLAVAKVGRSADLRVGDAAIVVGSPFGFQSSVTTGIVSALHRVVKVPSGENGREDRDLVDAIQTDAAINPGNSGGAVVNGNGEVVGISTAIATNGDSEANAGVGFAIPVDAAMEVATALVDRRPVKVPFLGADLDTDLSPVDIKRFQVGNRAGALVSAVRSRSPAAQAGLRRGDLVVRFGSQPVASSDQLTVALRQAEIGVPVPVTVVRRGRELALRVTPVDQPGR